MAIMMPSVSLKFLKTIKFVRIYNYSNKKVTSAKTWESSIIFDNKI